MAAYTGGTFDWCPKCDCYYPEGKAEEHEKRCPAMRRGALAKLLEAARKASVLFKQPGHVAGVSLDAYQACVDLEAAIKEAEGK